MVETMSVKPKGGCVSCCNISQTSSLLLHAGWLLIREASQHRLVYVSHREVGGGGGGGSIDTHTADRGKREGRGGGGERRVI